MISFPMAMRRRWFCSRVIDMAGREKELRVFMVSGELSGDSIAARLMAALKQLCPFHIRFAGAGGPMMYKQGLESSLFPMEDLSVMGIWELLPHLSKIRGRLHETAEAAVLFKPHVVVTVDSKGFSFRFLKLLRARCSNEGLRIPVQTHYVAPSFWAWKGGETKLKHLSGFVDHLLCILPFEEQVCRANGLSATFVGHPVLEDALNSNLENEPLSNKWKRLGSSRDFRSKHGLSSGATILTVLPGSRVQEVTCMLPIFSDALGLLKESFPQLTAVIPVAPNRHVQNHIDRVVQTWPVSTILIPGGSLNTKYDAFNASTAALSTSGTAVLELQLARVPCVVAYRAHLLTEWVVRARTKLKFMSLPNILLDSDVIPEVLFSTCTPNNIAAFLRQIIDDDQLREKQVVAADKVFELLSPPSNYNRGEFSSSVVCVDNHNNRPSINAAFTILYHANYSKSS